MKQWLRGRSRGGISTFFSFCYFLLVVMAMFPPIYLATSGLREPVVLGLPFTVFWWILNGALIYVLSRVMAWVESVRNELHTELADGTTSEEGED